MSQSGASSIGSGTDGGQSSVIEPVGNLSPGGDDEYALEDSRAISQGIFGVLYTVSKEKTLGWKWASFRLFLDFLQLWLILVNPAYGYTGWITQENKLWQVVSLINLTQFLEARGYTFFLACMYLMAAGLVLAIGLCAWVGYSFKSNRFDHVWPIVLLRGYSMVFFQVLDVASLTLFLVTLDCQLYFTEQPSRGIHQEFNVQCWAMPHMIHAAVSVVSLVLFAVMAGAFTMADMELSPLSSNPLAMAHSKVELISFVFKLIMTAASTLVMNLKWLSSIQAACCLLLVWLYFKWVPHMNSMMNNIRVGSLASIFYCSIMLLLLGFLPAVDYNEPADVRRFQESVTYAMWAGLVPAFALGWIATHWRQQWFQTTVLQTFKDALLSSKPQKVYKFTDAREVEVVSRCCRAWTPSGLLDEEQVKLAEAVMKAGMGQLPGSAFMVILYSSFLIDVQTSYQSGFSILNQAKKNDPSFLERFALFSREQQHAQKNAGNQTGQATDLVSYVEFQRNYRLVLKVHKEALLAVKAFWTCLLQRNVKFNSMSSCVDSIEMACRQAERVYRNVLQRHANNVKVVRLYAKFLEHVKYDPWAAAKWTAEAEKLELIEEEHKASIVFEEADVVDPALKQSLKQMEPIEGTTRAIIVINAQCIVQASNQATTDLLGWSRVELVGRNVSCIVPPPFGDRHNTYVQNYINTGKAVLLNTRSVFVAQHKDKHVVPISLHISKVSGIGEDTMFLGVIESTATEGTDTAIMWVLMNGQLVCVDPTFTDWFAYKNEEVIGTALSNYVLDYKRMEEPFRRARNVFKSHDSRGDTSHSSADPSITPSTLLMRNSFSELNQLVPGLAMTHKYADAVTVDVHVKVSSVGTHRFIRLELKRAGRGVTANRQMLVSDRKGRLLHVTHGLAAALGSNAKALIANDSRNALQGLMVQPFAQLHKCTTLQALPHAAPSFSCRSGLSTLLASMGPQGPGAAVFRMHVQQRKLVGGESNAWNVTTLEQRSLAEAIEERCVTLVLDADGYVLETQPGNGMSPFGFTGSVIGWHISTFVDIMSTAGARVDLDAARGTAAAEVKAQRRPPSPPMDELRQLDLTGTVARRRKLRVAMEADNQQDGEQDEELQSSAHSGRTPLPATGPPPMRVGSAAPVRSNPVDEKGAAALLLEMAAKSLECPGISWRCSVSRPRPPGSMQHTSNHVLDQLLAKAKDKPGMLSVQLLLDGDEMSAEGVALESDADFMRQQSRMSKNLDDMGCLSALDHPPAQRRGSVLSSVNNMNEVRFQVKIWRAKLVSSVIEVDGSQRVVGKNSEDKLHVLYPAGLVLGASDDMLYGQHISHLIPLGPRGIKGLYDSNIRPAPAGPKSLLKTRVKSDDKSVGPVHTLKVQHLGDGREMDITVQAVARLGRSQHTYLIVRAHNPQAGRPGFASWVVSGGLSDVAQQPAANLMSPRKRSSVPASVQQAPPVHLIAPHPTHTDTSTPRSAPPLAVKPEAQMHDLDRLEAQLLSGAPLRLPSEISEPDSTAPLKPQDGVKAVGKLPSASSPAPGAWPDAHGIEEDRTSEADRLAAVAAAQNPRIVRWIMSEMGDAAAPASEAQQLYDDPVLEEEEEEEEQSDGHNSDDQELDAAAAQVSTEGSDYRRGRRYKKLLRLLSSSGMQQRTTQFKIHTYGVVVALLIAHVAVFATIHILMVKQETGVKDLDMCGLALGFAGEIGMMSRQLELLVDPEPGMNVTLQGLSGPDCIPDLKSEYLLSIEAFKAAHSTFYLGANGEPRVLPDLNHLREIWETPALDQVVYDAIPTDESIDRNHTVTRRVQKDSLWNIGNSLVTAAHQIYAHGETYQKEYGHLHQFSFFQYIMDNMPNKLADNYYLTMDTMVQWVIQGAMNVNQVQQILLVLESCILCCAACGYLWYLSLKVAGQRYSVFSVFLAIPLSLARSLATKKLDLGDDDDEDEDADAAAAVANGGAAAGGDGAGNVNVKPSMTETQKGSGGISVFLRPADTEALANKSFVARVMSCLAFWRPPGSQSSRSSKRKLVQNYKQPLLLVWPFVLWGITIIATYATAVGKLASISGPIATYNMVNSVKSRTYMFFFELQELTASSELELVTEQRTKLMDKHRLLVKDWTALLYGGQALPNETSKHFTLATLGLTYSGGRAADILFYTTSCLCADPKDCKEDPDSIYYQDTHDGLARLMNHFLKNAETVGLMHGLDPALDGPAFEWFWYVRFDIFGGLEQLNAYYQSYVMQVYGSVLQIHIAALILTCIIMLGFVMLVLRPFIRKCGYETKRIAELLSQLPPDLDVEGLAMRALPKNPAALVVAAPIVPDMPKTLDNPGPSQRISLGSIMD